MPMPDLITEAEAEAKWCPLSNTGRPGEIRCIASKCMFWRWHPDIEDTNDQPTGFCGGAGLPKYM
jgi:hypothetical protein